MFPIENPPYSCWEAGDFGRDRFYRPDVNPSRQGYGSEDAGIFLLAAFFMSTASSFRRIGTILGFDRVADNDAQRYHSIESCVAISNVLEVRPNNDNVLKHMEIQSHVPDEEGLDEVKDFQKVLPDGESYGQEAYKAIHKYQSHFCSLATNLAQFLLAAGLPNTTQNRTIQALFGQERWTADIFEALPKVDMENPGYRGSYFSSYIGLACVKNDTGSGREPFLYSRSATAESKHRYRGEA
ncbi:MAG: hypothetical protein Q9164_006065 [Protoblastenia rupestris]